MLVRIGPYRKNRKLQVVIHRYDTWSMNSTLAHIIVPMLKQLKKTKHGIPGSMLSSEYNRLTSSKKYWKKSKNGPLHKKERKLFQQACTKWDDILNQMIWSYDQLARDKPEQDRYFKRTGKMKWKDLPNGNEELITTGYKYDKKGHHKYLARIQEGITLFGLHYQNLWD